MKWLKKVSAAGAAMRQADEKFYAMAFEELDRGIIRSGLWAKALASAQGDEAKARGLYLRYRVQAYRDDLALLENSLPEEVDERATTVPYQPRPAETPDHSNQPLRGAIGSSHTAQDIHNRTNGKNKNSERAYSGRSVDREKIPAWAQDEDELKGFKRTFRILASAKDISGIYIDERMGDRDFLTSLLRHLAEAEGAGATYMEQLNVAVEYMMENWRALGTHHRGTYISRDNRA